MRPSPCILLKVSPTVLTTPGSRVNFSRDQSQEAPSFFICDRIFLAFSKVKSSISRYSVSLSISNLERPSFSSFFSYTTCVSKPAWSKPGSHRVLKPCILLYRVIMSSMVITKPCPALREPLAFVGGMIIVKGLLKFGFVEGLSTQGGCASGAKNPESSQILYILSSVSLGL